MTSNHMVIVWGVQLFIISKLCLTFKLLSINSWAENVRKMPM